MKKIMTFMFLFPCILFAFQQQDANDFFCQSILAGLFFSEEENVIFPQEFSVPNEEEILPEERPRILPYPYPLNPKFPPWNDEPELPHGIPYPAIDFESLF